LALTACSAYHASRFLTAKMGKRGRQRRAVRCEDGHRRPDRREEEEAHRRRRGGIACGKTRWCEDVVSDTARHGRYWILDSAWGMADELGRGTDQKQLAAIRPEVIPIAMFWTACRTESDGV
jgi:hypothetical protein